jgi:hypothetical protein
VAVKTLIKKVFFHINQRLEKPYETLGFHALQQIKSKKCVTDEQVGHRFPVFSGIIAPPYDRVRKPS